MFKCKYEECKKDDIKTQRGKDMHEASCPHNPNAEAKAKVKETKTETTKPALTSDEQAMANRIEGQNVDWFTLREDELTDFSLMADPLLLPLAAQKLQDDQVYAFRWCERKPDRVDQLTRSHQPPLRWALVNKSNLPALADDCDSMIGGVLCLDQILLFKPWHHYVLVQKAKVALADAQYGGLKTQEQKSDGDKQFHASVRSMDKDKSTPFEVKDSDVVVADEAVVDQEMGIADDSSELGDLVVQE